MNTLINLHNMVGLINFKIDLVHKFGCPGIIELKTNTLNTIWRKYFHVLLIYDEIMHSLKKLDMKTTLLYLTIIIYLINI